MFRELREQSSVFAGMFTYHSGLLFGLAPALQATRFDLIPALKNDAVGVAAGRRRGELRRLLVVLQVAMSLVLLVSGGMFVRSLRNLNAVDHDCLFPNDRSYN